MIQMSPVHSSFQTRDIAKEGLTRWKHVTVHGMMKGGGNKRCEAGTDLR
jgi:hypothetical protein